MRRWAAAAGASCDPRPEIGNHLGEDVPRNDSFGDTETIGRTRGIQLHALEKHVSVEYAHEDDFEPVELRNREELGNVPPKWSLEGGLESGKEGGHLFPKPFDDVLTIHGGVLDEVVEQRSAEGGGIVDALDL